MATAADRAELANNGTFYWDAAYDMPEVAQIEVDAYPGVRWQTQKGTFWPNVSANDTTLRRRCDVVRTKAPPA